MTVEKTAHAHIFRSSDVQGRFEIRIQNKCNQLTIVNSITEDDPIGDDLFIDVSREELIVLRDMITQVVES